MSTSDMRADKKVLKGRSVLLVEDEWLIALDAQETLTELGAQVTVAASFEDGAAAAKSGTFDAAVLDVNLGGGQFSFPIGEILTARGTPLVYATGYNLRERPLEGYQGGHWIAKPYSRLGLERALRTVLNIESESDSGNLTPTRHKTDHHAN
ncbi:MAG: response regulator [Candidatus Binataceae bacterium]